MISVVVTCYNEESYIEQALNSVVVQTGWEHITEVIVVDDGSEDNSRDLIKDFAARYNEIVYIFESNQGVSGSKNAGIKASTNNWIAFLDGDDRWQPEKIQRQVDFILAHSEVGLVYTDYYTKKESGEKIPMIASHYTYDQEEDYVLKSLFITGGPIFPSTTLVRKDCLESVGYFNPKYIRSQDFDLALRIAARYPIHHIPEYLTVKNEKPDSFSADVPKAAKDQRRIVDQIVKDYPQLEPLRREKLARIEISKGYYNLIRDKKFKARSSLQRAIKKSKLIPKAWIYLFISYIPFLDSSKVVSFVKKPWRLLTRLIGFYFNVKQKTKEKSEVNDGIR